MYNTCLSIVKYGLLYVFKLVEIHSSIFIMINKAILVEVANNEYTARWQVSHMPHGAGMLQLPHH